MTTIEIIGAVIILVMMIVLVTRLDEKYIDWRKRKNDKYKELEKAFNDCSAENDSLRAQRTERDKEIASLKSGLHLGFGELIHRANRFSEAERRCKKISEEARLWKNRAKALERRIDAPEAIKDVADKTGYSYKEIEEIFTLSEKGTKETVDFIINKHELGVKSLNDIRLLVLGGFIKI